MYSSSEVTEDDTLLVASLSLPAGIIRPCCFEPECPVELEASFSSETEKVHDHSGEKQLGNTTIVSTDIEVAITVLTGVHGGSQQGESLHFIYPKVQT